MRVLVGMSGGVDSSTAAFLLKQQGHEVVGVTLLLWGGPKNDRSCSTSDETAAKRAAEQVGIEHITLDLTDQFDHKVVDKFAAAAAVGVTDNPCISCNKEFKLDFLFAWAKEHGFDAVATGHYAQKVATSAGYRLARGLEDLKDQSYVLYPATKDQLSMLLLPLGGFTKSQIREIAASAGLDAATAEESMNLCFSRELVLSQRSVKNVVPVTLDDQEVAQADATMVTVGQRLRLPGFPTKVYVSDISETSVTISQNPNVSTSSVFVPDWQGFTPETRLRGYVAQFSAHGIKVKVTVSREGTGFRLHSDTPFRLPAPGQHAVIYAGNNVVGGGAISK